MKMRSNMPGLSALIAALWCISASPVAAQTNYPDKPIQVLVGFPAGASADILSRYYTKKLQELTKQTILLENKPGLFGLLAGGVAARAKPDGYTVWFTPSIPAARILLKESPFNPDTDFAPVAALFQTPLMLSVSGKSEIKSVAQLVEHLRNTRGRYG